MPPSEPFPPPPLACLGKAIAQARAARGLTRRDLAKETRIPERYVEAIESGAFARLPGKTFILGFTRTICRRLDLDADSIIATIKRELF